MCVSCPRLLLYSDFVADWAQIDAFLAGKLACTIVPQCNTHSAVSIADVEHHAHDDPADDSSMTSTDRALFLSNPIVCDGCDSKLTFADVTGRGQLYLHIVQQELGGLVLAGLNFYVNCLRFPLPNAAHIFDTSFDDTLYEFGNACESCCAKIQARADAATEYGPKFFAETSGVLIHLRWPKPLISIVLAYSCTVKLATDQCTADSCL